MIDQIIAQWLKQKEKNMHTQRQYKSTLNSFRSFLREETKLDLIDDLQLTNICAQIWVCQTTNSTNISHSTIKSRISIISAFYEFVHSKRVIPYNPIQNIGKVMNTSSAQIPNIDRATLEGKRNFALIMTVKETCKPYAQVADLSFGDLKFEHGICMISWKRSMTKSILTLQTSQSLIFYLEAVYGSLHIAQNAPVWVSFSNRNKAKSVSQKTVSNICTGVLEKCHSSVESSDVVQMYQQGYTVLQIRDKLEEKENSHVFRQIYSSADS
jgi:site-specific recombinase XerD